MKPVSITFDDNGNLQIAARTIPLPTSVSDAARRFLATQFPTPAEPELSDKAAWKNIAAAVDKMFAPMVTRVLENTAATVERGDLNGAIVYVGTPHVMQHADWAHLSLHGGSWVFLGGDYAKAESAIYAAAFGCTTFSLDYRMPPDHPFPAAVDDAFAAYTELLKRYDPKKIVISGGSAGGNIAAAVTLKIRDNGLPLPGAVGLLTGSLDLTRSGDSIHAHDGIDTVLRPFGKAGALYADGHDQTDPYLSPLFGDFSKGFPPTFLQSGTRDLLLSDTVRMHRKLLQGGNEAELHIWEAMPHGGFGGAISGAPTPEDLEIRAQFLRFLEKYLG
ncbi:MAG: esterase [Verrucomicrobiaceae bacterium]|nr:esterase [Verrucomicrobiaceae bacterium]